MEKEDRKHVTRYSPTDVVKKLSEVYGQRFDDYRKEWDRACKVGEGYVPSKPLFLDIGINSDCNLRCKMCVRAYDKSMNNKHENMSLEMFGKIMQEVKELGIPAMLIGQESECLLHPQIKEIIRMAKEANPVDLFIITNGTLLNEEMSEYIIDMGVDRLEISVDAARKETYKTIRGGNLDILEKNIENFLRIRAEKGKERPFLRLSFCKQDDNISEQEEFLEKWKDKVDIVDFQEYVDLSNVLELKEKKNIKTWCDNPFDRLVIEYSGEIYGCCCVGFNRYNRLGNINEMSLMDAWNCEEMNDLRNSFITQNIRQVCLNCRSGVNTV